MHGRVIQYTVRHHDEQHRVGEVAAKADQLAAGSSGRRTAAAEPERWLNDHHEEEDHEEQQTD